MYNSVRFTFAAICSCLTAAVGEPAHRLPPPILDYIKSAWSSLTRTHRDLAAAAADPKVRPPANGRWPVWLPADEDLPRIEQELRGSLKTDFEKIELRRLPSDITQIRDHGLLYLPHSYVVPGGRFNEMYGWDSFFIVLGLLHDGQVELAKNMADNFLYEIREYGKILNANRTYYLTRSQPPFLTEILLSVYERTRDRQWLMSTLPAIEKYYSYWTAAPHLTPETGLSRYFDSGDGPAPEAAASEVDSQGRTDYDLIRRYFRTHQTTDDDSSQYYDRASDRLTPAFYKGDRSMRESGFDVSNRFGPFNAGIVDYNPVCLNSLLYLMEIQSAEILGILGREQDARPWQERARNRAEAINRWMWDREQGLYFDYNFTDRRIRRYPFLTTFYPLWVGIASPEQADRVVRNLRLFERPGGLQTSTHRSGEQWDAPFGWAPLQWIAVQGLRRYGYGYNSDADRISNHFLALVKREYEKHGTIVEKYDVVRQRADTSAGIRFGYFTNEIGFGWTNAVFEALLDQLPPADQQTLTRQ